MKSIKETIAQMWGAPLEVALNLERITITGNREIYVENYKSIVKYKPDEIVLKTETGILHICGKNLKILHLGQSNIMIYGYFSKIYHEILKKEVKNVK